MDRRDGPTELGLYTDKTILYVIQHRIMRRVYLRVPQGICR